MISKFKKKFLLWSIIAIFLTLVIGCTGLTNSKNNKSTEKINTTKNPVNDPTAEIPKISDEQLKDLIHNAAISIPKLPSIWGSGYANEENHQFIKLKKDITDVNSLSQYLNEELKLNSYFSDEFINKFINFTFKKINGFYYSLMGNFPDSPDNIKIVDKKYEGNKLYLKLTLMYGDGSSIDRNVTLIYNNSKWLIDKMNIWGIPVLSQ